MDKQLKYRLKSVECNPLDKEYIMEAINIIIKQDKTIESLKCCGNCDLENIWYGENDCPHRDKCVESVLSGSKSFWKPINK